MPYPDKNSLAVTTISMKPHLDETCVNLFLQQDEPDFGVVAVHACGALTDWTIQAAVARRAPLAVMPCCYGSGKCRNRTGHERHSGLEQTLGKPLLLDIQRTYDLEAQGYAVTWQEIPEEITPMNRILLAHPAGIRS
eukprot:gnl/TRDRNA2_/TRDRNA2_144560_c0_seq2.p2 gnl/TRDRNA2_/TRDRNA2_144560_c0~~gnl/TRDRNA2_/TRDRNA2_144560_c0_seq2.p2  ORF type:complete len:137 (-),score=15.23 gnl/TRDRNA2_/TRDRNA2_144560_c0_seq2:23-433(-)